MSFKVGLVVVAASVGTSIRAIVCARRPVATHGQFVIDRVRRQRAQLDLPAARPAVAIAGMVSISVLVIVIVI